MGVLKATTTTKASEEDVVYSEDADVSVPAELKGCGWIPQGECHDRPGADVLRIRALNPSERSRSRDIWARSGEASMNHYVARQGVVRWGKEKKAEAVAKLVDRLALIDAVALDLLANRILLLTRGEDPKTGYAFARQALGVDDERAPAEGEEGDQDGGSKSDA